MKAKCGKFSRGKWQACWIKGGCQFFQVPWSKDAAEVEGYCAVEDKSPACPKSRKILEKGILLTAKTKEV
jgi:hypothetical protein